MSVPTNYSRQRILKLNSKFCLHYAVQNVYVVREKNDPNYFRQNMVFANPQDWDMFITQEHYYYRKLSRETLDKDSTIWLISKI